jgi:YVTN family beta-propeller protein
MWNSYNAQVPYLYSFPYVSYYYPYQPLEYPHYPYFAIQAASRVYVTNFSASTVSVINTNTNTITSTIPIATGRYPYPLGVAITPDGKKVYVVSTSRESSYNVTVIGTPVNRVLKIIPIREFSSPEEGVSPPADIAVAPNGIYVYVVDNYNKTVSVINTNSDTVIATISGFTDPKGVAVAPDGTAYVTNGTGVSVIDTKFNVNKTIFISLGGYPYKMAVTPNGKWLYVANMGSANVSVIDTATQKRSAVIPVGEGPNAVAITPDGTKVYVANYLDYTVSVIATANNAVIATIRVGRNPTGVAITPDGTKVYVANSLNENVSVIATANNAVIATISFPPGSGPRDVAVG